MSGPVRAAAAWALLVALALGTAGCGEGSRATAVSPGSRHALAGRVLDILDGSGLPIEDDHVGCLAGADGRSDICYAMTSDEPVQRVEGRFVVHPGAPGGCAGTLTVILGPSEGDPSQAGPVHTLEQVSEDPCR